MKLPHLFLLPAIAAALLLSCSQGESSSTDAAADPDGREPDLHEAPGDEGDGPDLRDGADPAMETDGEDIQREPDETDITADLCNPPVGNILQHGEFEEGMSGSAPVGWEVRNPDIFSTTCFASPDSYMRLGPPPDGCSGRSLEISTGGTWDCYAIQTVSGYSTIQGGRTYRISAAVRSEGNSVNPAAWFLIGVQWLDASDRFFGDEKNPPTAGAGENDFDWKLLTFDIVAPPDAARILVWLTAHYPGTVQYDNVAVVQID